MDLLRYLLSFLVRVTVAILFFLIVWWLFATLYPNLKLKTLLSQNVDTTESKDILPSPRTFRGLLGKPIIPTSETNVYVPGTAFNGYGNAYNGNIGGAQVDYVTYTTEGTKVIKGPRTGSMNGESTDTALNGGVLTGYAQKSLYIRNLSIYEGGHIYTGITFVGDAKSTMFSNGIFPIIIADKDGRPLVVAKARATTGFTPPGWSKFEVRIDAVLPNRIPCTMVFQQGVSSSYTQGLQPIRVAIPVLCN